MRSAQELQNDLHSIRDLLRRGSFLSLPDSRKERLIEDSLKLTRKLDDLAESSLVAGLLGGTGVGKSSLMNALAGAPVTDTSHRRPHTDQVLIYHHFAMPLPDTLTTSPQPRREITHEVESIRHIVLCDLPDFDGLLSEHRDQVLQFLEHLDILIWVTTPEKYADERFYAFLRQVPKARQNFYFVLNKVDLLFPNAKPETGHSQLSAVMAGFSRHLRDNDVSMPIIFAVSAREGGEAGAASPWNHFWNFRNQIFQMRDAKEMREIRAANLDVEVKQFTEFLEKEVSGLSILHGVLDDAVSDLQNHRTEWMRIGHETFRQALERNQEKLLPQPAHTRALVGIGFSIAAIAGDWIHLTHRSDERPKNADLFLRTESLQPLERELERVEHRIIHQALQKGHQPSKGDYGKYIFDADAEWKGLRQRLQEVVTQSIEHDFAPSFKGFRTLQYFSYLGLPGLLFVALTGEAGLQELIERPSGNGLLGLVLALIRTLFSPKGFAALGSYLLLRTFLGFRFYRRYKKLLQRHTRKIIESLKLLLNQIWEEELNTLIDQLSEKARQVDERIAALRALRGSDKDN